MTKTKKKIFLISMVTALVIILSFLLFLSRSIELGYMLSQVTPAYIGSNVCKTSPQTREKLNISLKNLYENLGYTMSYSEWLRREVRICASRIYVYEAGGGYFKLSMYDLQGNLVDSCEQYHTVMGISKGAQCYAPKGSLKWQEDK